MSSTLLTDERWPPWPAATNTQFSRLRNPVIVIRRTGCAGHTLALARLARRKRIGIRNAQSRHCILGAVLTLQVTHSRATQREKVAQHRKHTHAALSVPDGHQMMQGRSHCPLRWSPGWALPRSFDQPLQHTFNSRTDAGHHPCDSVTAASVSNTKHGATGLTGAASSVCSSSCGVDVLFLWFDLAFPTAVEQPTCMPHHIVNHRIQQWSREQATAR